ncbi:MAG: hypothetical protein NZX77_22705, partial [Polyangiaceae bacterium]|nr:hypothetical protein [Polyangiaceae bacterium]
EGKKNWLDIDADGDGKPDGEEGTDDLDDDGLPNFLDPEDGIGAGGSGGAAGNAGAGGSTVAGAGGDAGTGAGGVGAGGAVGGPGNAGAGGSVVGSGGASGSVGAGVSNPGMTNAANTDLAGGCACSEARQVQASPGWSLGGVVLALGAFFRRRRAC